MSAVWQFATDRQLANFTKIIILELLIAKHTNDSFPNSFSLPILNRNFAEKFSTVILAV
jgi:hypothetical protein